MAKKTQKRSSSQHFFHLLNSVATTDDRHSSIYNTFQHCTIFQKSSILAFQAFFWQTSFPAFHHHILYYTIYNIIYNTINTYRIVDFFLFTIILLLFFYFLLFFIIINSYFEFMIYTSLKSIRTSIVFFLF